MSSQRIVVHHRILFRAVRLPAVRTQCGYPDRGVLGGQRDIHLENARLGRSFPRQSTRRGRILYRRSGRRTLAAGSGTTQNLRGPGMDPRRHPTGDALLRTPTLPECTPGMDARPTRIAPLPCKHLVALRKRLGRLHQPVAIPASAGHAGSGPAGALGRIGPE